MVGGGILEMVSNSCGICRLVDDTEFSAFITGEINVWFSSECYNRVSFCRCKIGPFVSRFD